MDFNHFILTVNTSSVVLLFMLTLILLISTHFRGERAYAAMIAVVPTVPVYLYNLSRMLLWGDMALFFFPLAYSLNTTLVPLLWFFTLRTFNPDFKIRPIQLLHLFPMLFFFGYTLTMTPEERLLNIEYEAMGSDLFVGNLNTLVVALQLLIYFPLIFIYISRKRRSVTNLDSDAEWIKKVWVYYFMILFALLFVVVILCNLLWPRTDTWLIQVLNVILMGYLIYHEIRYQEVHPLHNASLESLKEENRGTEPEPLAMDLERMKELSDEITQFLEQTKLYLRPDLTLALLAVEMQQPQRSLSRAINLGLKCNFFTLINQLRVEEAKRRLLELDASGYSIDSIFSECGFSSRSSFFMVFKRIAGVSPAVWLSKQKQ